MIEALSLDLNPADLYRGSNKVAIPYSFLDSMLYFVSKYLSIFEISRELI